MVPLCRQFNSFKNKNFVVASSVFDDGGDGDAHNNDELPLDALSVDRPSAISDAMSVS